MRPRFIGSWLMAALLAVIALPSFAQQKPKLNAQVLVGVKTAVTDANNIVYTRIYGPGEPDRLYYATPAPGAGFHYLDTGNILMTPGKHYQMMFSCEAWKQGFVKFSAPPGYTIYLDDRPIPTRGTTDFGGGLGSYLIYKIVLRPNDEGASLPAGMAIAPQVGDMIWSISAGRYANGLSAGAVQWRSRDLSPDLLDPHALIYDEPGSGEVFVSHYSDGALLSIQSNQFTLYVRRNSTPGTGYTIEIYHPFIAPNGSGDGPYTFSEGPYRKFIVSNPDGAWQNRISVEKQELGEITRSNTWVISKQGNDWSIIETEGSRVTKLLSTLNPAQGRRVETATVETTGGTVATKSQRTYQTFSWNQEELVQEIADPDNLALSTSYQYYTGPGSSLGRLKSVTHPDGSWVRYEYDEGNFNWGDLVKIYTPWQDGPASPDAATLDNCKVTLLEFAGWGTVFSDELPSGSTTRILGTTHGRAKTSFSTPADAPNGQPLQVMDTITYGSAGPMNSATAMYRDTASPDYRFRLHWRTAADGTKTSYLRYQGYWWNYGDSPATNFHKWPGNPAADTVWGEYRFSGFSSQVKDSVPVNSWDGQSFETVYMVPNRSTIALDIYNAEGQVGSQAQFVFLGASGGVPNFEFLSQTETAYQNGIAFKTVSSNGQYDELWMIQGRLSGHTYNDGTYVEYTRDPLGRDYMDRRWYVYASGEYPEQGITYTHKTFDIAGRVLTEKISSSSDAAANPVDAVTTSRKYNLAGLLISETTEVGAGNFITTYSYTNGGRTVTMTLPGGATKVTESYLDGSPKSVTGTGVVPTYYKMFLDGEVTMQTNLGSPTSPRWSKTATGWAGEVVKSESPGFNGTTLTKQYIYNGAGQLVRSTETGLADKVYMFNDWQQPYRSGLDMNGTKALEPVSNDRFTESDAYYEQDGSGAWWRVSISKAYTQTDSGTPTTMATTKERINKYSGDMQMESISLDIFGNQSRQTIEVNRAEKLVTTTTHKPDSSIDEITYTRNGLTQKIQNKQGLVTRFYYDARGRQVKQTDPRIDPSATPRVGYLDHSDRVAWTQDSVGNQTNTAYYSDTGRIYSTTNPLGKATYFSYDKLGRVIHTWGAATYPVQYSYNNYGEQVAMKTYRDTSVDWTQGTWPVSDSAGDQTTWNYEEATGLLLSKVDAQNHAVNYTYTARGQLAKRSWARGIDTNYGYDDKTGEQTSLTYSDGTTPSVNYTYDRRGLNSSITDGLGTRTFDHCDCGKVIAEFLPGFYENREVHWALDNTTEGAKGRTTRLSFGTHGNGADEYHVGFGYDAYGRVASVMGLNYSYTPNSNLVASIADPGSGWAQYRNYESNRNLLASIETKYSTVTKSNFGYTHDQLGRRTSLTQNGEIFTNYLGGALTTGWGYNDRSEVTSGQTTYSATGAPVIGRTFGYTYDPIGNRLTSKLDDAQTSYTPNELNQYTQRADSGQVMTSGLAPASATITVNGEAASRQGEFFGKSVWASNGANANWAGINISSDLGGSITRFTFVPPTPESYDYDEDGNIRSDARWNYTWDAENRLIAMETRDVAYWVGTPRQRLEFTYDYLGRRVQKRVLATNESGWWSLTYEHRFIYDGWNLMAEADTTSGAFILKTLYVWGIDLSGNLQDAGGVGGLIGSYEVATGLQLLPAYDGNGNIYGMVDRSTGNIRAVYEYSSYGEILRSSGDMASKNPYRFSTKYTDDETQFIYYGFRYYSPSLGRFYGRDPMGEKGGLHLYAFCGNNGVNNWDYLGQWGDNSAGNWGDLNPNDFNPGGAGYIDFLARQQSFNQMLEALSHSAGGYNSALPGPGDFQPAFGDFGGFDSAFKGDPNIVGGTPDTQTSSVGGGSASTSPSPFNVDLSYNGSAGAAPSSSTPGTAVAPDSGSNLAVAGTVISTGGRAISGAEALINAGLVGTTGGAELLAAPFTFALTGGASVIYDTLTTPTEQQAYYRNTVGLAGGYIPRENSTTSALPTVNTPTDILVRRNEPVYVVRGGITTPEQLQNGVAEHRSVPGLNGFSVQSFPGLSVDQLAAAGQFPHKTISFTTTEQLLLVGVLVVPSPGIGFHATATTLNPLPLPVATLISSQFEQKPNPAPVRRGPGG